MSFSRAKRFDYKPPDLDISPADYNLCTNLFEKGVIIPKCPRFRNRKHTEDGNPCRRLNCCRDKPTCKASSSKDVRKMNPIPEKSSSLNKLNSTRTSAKSTCSKNKPETEHSVNKSKTFVQNIIQNFERLARTSESSEGDSPFASTDEFIDDDYHSYTSSEELETLKKMEEFEFNEVCKAYKDMVMNRPSCSGSSINDVENVLLQKMDKLEQTMESVKQDFSNLNTQHQIVELERTRNIEQTKIEQMRDYLEQSMEKYSKENCVDISKMITKAIEYLNREFEKKRMGVLRESEEKIRQLIDDIYMTSNESGEDMKKLCRTTAHSLTQRLDNTMRSTYMSLEDSKSSSLMIEHGSLCSEDNNENFNYENVCKVLSEQLQLTQDEKDNLELEKLDMTLKCNETEQALQAQANVIDLLHSEIAALRNYISKKKC